MSILNDHRGLSVFRRRFLGAGALTAAVGVPALAVWNPVSARADSTVGGTFEQNDGFLQAAVSAAQWIQSVQRDDGAGTYWLPEPDHPEKLSTISAPNTIYSGSAGTVLFLLQRARATAETHYRDTAVRGRRLSGCDLA